jgi:hypothetical protein
MLCFLFFQQKGDFSILMRVILLGQVKFLACLCAPSQHSLALVVNCHSSALCCKVIEQFAGQGSLSTTRLGVSRNWQPPGWVVVRLNSSWFLAALPDELLYPLGTQCQGLSPSLIQDVKWLASESFWCHSNPLMVHMETGTLKRLSVVVEG